MSIDGPIEEPRGMRSLRYLPWVFAWMACHSAPTAPARESQGQEISVTRDAVVLKGTELLPDEAEAAVPVALIIAGSGPTDRDGNSILGVRSDAYRMFAAELMTRGLATVRFDKRGVGQSGTNFAVESVVIDDFVRDTVAWIERLRADSRFGKLTLIGHSEGALIAILAAQTAPPDALILVGASARRFDELVRNQLLRQLPPSSIEEYDRIIHALRTGSEAGPVPSELQPLFGPPPHAFFASLLPIDPVAELRKLRNMPVTVIHGSTDMQIPAQDAERLAQARPDVQFKLIERMNHVLKDEPMLDAPQASYTDPARPLAFGLVDALAEGIAK